MEILWWLQSKEEEMIVKMIYNPTIGVGNYERLDPSI